MIKSVFDLQAELARALSNAGRLRLVHALRERPQCVGELAAGTELTPAQVSQHLAVLRTTGIVAAQRHGAAIVYRLANPKIARLCDVMGEWLADRAEERSELIEALRQPR